MDLFLVVVASLAVAFIVLIVCRELFCWYAKINERLDIHAESLKEQKKQTALLEQTLTEQYAIKAYLEAIQGKE